MVPTGYEEYWTSGKLCIFEGCLVQVYNAVKSLKGMAKTRKHLIIIATCITELCLDIRAYNTIKC